MKLGFMKLSRSFHHTKFERKSLLQTVSTKIHAVRILLQLHGPTLIIAYIVHFLRVKTKTKMPKMLHLDTPTGS